MNKQEFQQTIKNMKPPKFFTAITINEAYEAGFEEAKCNALCNSCFLNEPEKPVVPRCVADFITSEQRSCSTLSEAIDNMDMMDEGEVTSWFYDNSETFAKAWLYGYEVEKEKLYTVELPDPNGSGKHVLVRGIKGDVFIGHKCPNNWREVSYYQLTESEIKQDFEWAWRFAKEVEE